jgi:hypothetical protein
VQEADRVSWPSPSTNNFEISYPRVPGRITSSFRAVTALCRWHACFDHNGLERRRYLAMITGVIITKLYPVRSTPNVSRKPILADIEARLDQWFIRLPEELRYETSSRRQVPPPHILLLHIRYWGNVLLLNRALYVTSICLLP